MEQHAHIARQLDLWYDKNIILQISEAL